MVIQDAKLRVEQWDSLLKDQQESVLKEALYEAPLIEVADFISKKSLKTFLKLFSFFDRPTQATLFSFFSEEQQLKIYSKLPRRVLADILVHMASDERVDFYQKLDEREQTKLLPYFPKTIKQDIIALCAYPVETAGGIMSTDFATIQETMTVAQALKKVREDAPSRKMMYYLYVVDEDMKMKGILSLKDLVMEEAETKISKILQDTFIYVKVQEDRESVAHKIEKYDLVALPVLNEEQQLVGIVSYDDAMDVIRAEQTEDMERFMGIVPEEHGGDYLHTSSVQHFKKRITWIIGLFFASFASALVMHRYEKMLGQLGILLLYFPMINDAGGNTGSQAATVVIRALSLGQVSIKDWLVIIFKEIKVSLMFVCCLFFLGFFKVILFSGILADTVFEGNHLPLPAEGLYQLALVISITLSLQIITSTLVGAGLPLFIKWMGSDPALAASPAITTIVDVTGLLIYFTVAMLLLTP